MDYMATIDEVVALRAAMDALLERAEAHFATSFEAASRLGAPRFSSSFVDANWHRYVPPELISAGDDLGRMIPPLTSRLVRLVQRSSLLSEADVRDVKRLTKAMMAALRFRRHSEWSTEVLHDEGTVLGTNPAGQSDSEQLSITESLDEFRTSFREVGRLLAFLVTEEQDLPAAIAATHEPSVVRFRPRTAFIIMWIDQAHPELEDVKEAIKDEFQRFGIIATRSDEIEHAGVITERILNEIAASEFLIADLTGERPSVYYEVGYAHAIGKRPMLFRRHGTALHFDLSVHNCPEYENVTDLRGRLRKRLAALTNREVQD
jgi:hypothetical protein